MRLDFLREQKVNNEYKHADYVTYLVDAESWEKIDVTEKLLNK